MNNKEILTNVKKEMYNNLAVALYENVQKEKEEFEYGFIRDAKNYIPKNIENRNYNGINKYYLYSIGRLKEYDTNIYMTFLQAKNNDIIIKSGEHGYKVYFFKPQNIINNKKNENENDENENNEKLQNVKKILIAKMYTVFNIDQMIENENTNKIKEKLMVKDNNNFDNSNIILKNIEKLLYKDGINIKERLANENPFVYSNQKYEKESNIYMPSRKLYKSEYNYIHDMIHEISHLMSSEKGTYNQEEIVAETSALFTAIELGITDKGYKIESSSNKYIYDYMKNENRETAIEYMIKGIKISEKIIEKYNDIKIENEKNIKNNKGIEM